MKQHWLSNQAQESWFGMFSAHDAKRRNDSKKQNAQTPQEETNPYEEDEKRIISLYRNISNDASREANKITPYDAIDRTNLKEVEALMFRDIERYIGIIKKLPAFKALCTEYAKLNNKQIDDGYDYPCLSDSKVNVQMLMNIFKLDRENSSINDYICVIDTRNTDIDSQSYSTSICPQEYVAAFVEKAYGTLYSVSTGDGDEGCIYIDLRR